MASKSPRFEVGRRIARNQRRSSCQRSFGSSATTRCRPPLVGLSGWCPVAGPWGSAASLGRLLDPITQDACAFYKDHGLFNDFPGVYETAEGDRIAQALGNKTVILRSHGLLTVGSTVDGAAWWFITMDRSCQVQILAASVGNPFPCHEYAIDARDKVAGGLKGWFQYQPPWQMINRAEHDMFK